MSATSSSSDKYLFLFNTDSDDLSSVRTALLDYYKFPAGTDNLFECTGCSNFRNTYKTLVEKLCGTDPAAPVYKMPDANGTVPSGETKMNTLIVVISGNADSLGLTTGTPAVTSSLTWSQVRQTIFGTLPQTAGPPKTYAYQDYTEIHVIFASPYCIYFLAEWNTNVPVTNGTLIIPPTVSDQIDQSEREIFISGIAEALRLETGAGLDLYGRMSFNGIAASIADATFRTTGGNFFPGYSYLEIHDGSPSWWESDDIYINSYNNDLYNSGAINTVYIKVHTAGTHPVKDFWLGAKHFGSGLGPADALIIAHLQAGSADLPFVLEAGEEHVFEYDLTFATTTSHRCIVARISFEEILSSSLDDYSDWSIVANINEAQRNIDPAPVAPTPTPPPPDPDEAQYPDPDPQPDPEDQNNTGDRSLNNIRGMKQHFYSIRNTFREKRRFRLVLHDEFRKYAKIVNVSFFRMKENKVAEKLRISTRPYPHIPLFLESGEKAEILCYIALKPKVKLPKEIRLPMEIMVEIKGVRPVNLRKSPYLKPDRNYASTGGITVKLITRAYSIYGRVYNRNGKPVAGAKVSIRTVNGRQAALLITDEKGGYIMKGINPDSYRVSVISREWSSGIRIVNLFSRDLNIDFMEGK